MRSVPLTLMAARPRSLATGLAMFTGLFFISGSLLSVVQSGLHSGTLLGMSETLPANNRVINAADAAKSAADTQSNSTKDKIVSENDTPVERQLEQQLETGGPSGPEPTRYGDWERKGRCIDF